MHIKPVKVYKMNEDFKVSSTLIYMAEYDDEHNLMNVYDSSQEKLTRIMGDLSMDFKFYQGGFFIEEDLPDLID